ncbi:MAG: radical SAM protein, partial [Firmicutes bacterium]|nr:radical SAM protein [Bacillota bacterium]
MKISRVLKNSIACELGIKSGSQVLAFDGHEMVDLFDYDFYNGEEEFVLTIKEGSEVVDYEIEKDFDEDLGLEFEDTFKIRQCKNKCIFCFVDQLPKDGRVRETLKIKDDDYRHSVIYSNFITMTNMTDEDFDRIARLNLSPLYISVHTTDDEVRQMMMGRKYDDSINERLEFLAEEGIEVHAQIVYCPFVNEDLEDSIEDLAETCASLAIVPVGLTKNSNPNLKPVTREIAENVIKLVEKKQKHFLELYGTR